MRVKKNLPILSYELKMVKILTPCVYYQQNCNFIFIIFYKLFRTVKRFNLQKN